MQFAIKKKKLSKFLNKMIMVKAMLRWKRGKYEDLKSQCNVVRGLACEFGINACSWDM